MARHCVADWPAAADKLAGAFWPGPLTLVLPRSKEIPDIVTAGGGTVGIRWPAHPLMQKVIRACGFPLAAPSANLSSHTSPTNAQHVWKSLSRKIPLIIDGGQCQVGIESTVVDLTVQPPRVLRPGIIHAQSLRAVTGESSATRTLDTADGPPRSPGLSAKHYATKARLIVRRWVDDADLRKLLSNVHCPLPAIHVIAHTTIPSDSGFGRTSVIPHDPEAFARALYAELHRSDETGAQLIVVESVPDSIEWLAIADRLSRASAE